MAKFRLPSEMTLLPLLGLLLASAGCGPRVPAAVQPGPRVPPTVTVLSPYRQTLSREVEQPARIDAFEETPVFVKVSGYVAKVHVEIGSRVRQGDPLAELWIPELEEELKQKAALVVQARLDITLAETTVRVMQASHATAASLVEEARASRKRAIANLTRWKSEAARMVNLTDQKIVDLQVREETQQQYQAAAATVEEADARIISAEAAREETLAKRDKATAEVDSARQRLELAEIERRRVAALLQYSKITAPYDGVVSQRNVHTGHFLQPMSGPASKAEPLFVVVRTDKVRVFLEVPEADAVLIKCGPGEGSLTNIRVPVLNDREFVGRVTGSSWSLEPGQRTLRTEIDFDNPEGVLRPGMYAQAVIQVEQPNAWVVPATALWSRDGLTYCWCLEGDKVVRTAVRIGLRQGGLAEVLKKQRVPGRPGEKPRWEDLAGNEQVVSARVSELSDGQVVQAVAENADKVAGGG